MITPLAVASILMLAMLAVTANAQEDNNTGSTQQQSNSTENAQESNNTGNATSTGAAENATSTGMPENTTLPSGSTANTTSPIGSTTNNATLPSGPTPRNSTGNATADFVNTILAVHNSERDAVGSPSLAWSNKLAAEAKVWAEHLATTGKIEHDPNRHTAMNCSMTSSGGHCIMMGVGENIARGPFDASSSKGLKEGQMGWVDEKKDYHGECCPYGTAPPVVGHYTQMVWNTTKEVGCATASGSSGSILVCKYYPWGNLPGQKPYSNTAGSVPQSNTAGSVPQSNNTGSVPQSNNAGQKPYSESLVPVTVDTQLLLFARPNEVALNCRVMI